jgi:hypothetical protein
VDLIRFGCALKSSYVVEYYSKSTTLWKEPKCGLRRSKEIHRFPEHFIEIQIATFKASTLPN